MTVRQTRIITIFNDNTGRPIQSFAVATADYADEKRKEMLQVADAKGWNWSVVVSTEGAVKQ
jgi:hypothetical protein